MTAPPDPPSTATQWHVAVLMSNSDHTILRTLTQPTQQRYARTVWTQLLAMQPIQPARERHGCLILHNLSYAQVQLLRPAWPLHTAMLQSA